MPTRYDLRQSLRRRMGSDEVSEEFLDEAISLALEEINRLVPKTEYRTLAITAGVETYSITDATVIRVTDLWLALSATHVSEMQAAYGASEEEYAGMRLFHSPSLAHILEHKWEQWNYRYEYDWEFDADARTLLIIPAPRYTGMATYRAALARDVAEVPERYIPALRDLAYAETLEILGNSSGMIQSLPVGIGNVVFNTDQLLSRAEEIRGRARRKLGRGGSSVIIG